MSGEGRAQFAHVIHSPRGRAAIRAEQDEAAGGPERRRVEVADGVTATASVSLYVHPRGRRVYASLRYKTGGKTHSHYLGNVTADGRQEALRLAWGIARARGLV